MSNDKNIFWQLQSLNYIVCFLKFGLIFVNLSTHTQVNSNPIKKLFGPHTWFSKNLYSVGWATLCSKSEAMLLRPIILAILLNGIFSRLDLASVLLSGGFSTRSIFHCPQINMWSMSLPPKISNELVFLTGGATILTSN